MTGDNRPLMASARKAALGRANAEAAHPACTNIGRFLKRYCPSRRHHRSHRREQNFRTSLFWATLGQATACLLSDNLGASGMKHNSRSRN